MRIHDLDPPPRRLKAAGKLDGWAGPALPEPIEGEDRRTPGQRRRARRDVVICVAVAAGLSRRFVAQALGLPRSRVGEIVARQRGLARGRDAG